MLEDATPADQPFTELRWSLSALARAGSGQRALFRDAALPAGELAADFDRCALFVRGEYDDRLSASQKEALTALDRKLSAMARDGADFDVDLWTDDALRTSPHWADVRELAAEALTTFGWPVEPTAEQEP